MILHAKYCMRCTIEDYLSVSHMEKNLDLFLSDVTFVWYTVALSHIKTLKKKNSNPPLSFFLLFSFLFFCFFVFVGYHFFPEAADTGSWLQDHPVHFAERTEAL